MSQKVLDTNQPKNNGKASQSPFPLSKADIIQDYRLGYMSRQASLLGRREVLTGKGKFGIFGDGKEVAQLAMARAFQNGDFRSGYYRDQTFMFAIGAYTIQQFFAQLYSHMDVEYEPASAGRQMNGHFATRTIDENGDWQNLTDMKNSSADGSPTASQMPRTVGLAYASKLYRILPELKDYTKFSHNGNEIAFATIGDASTSEGPFWESLNALGVLQAPAIVSVWDDGYGISVPRKFQTTKDSISVLLQGFNSEGDLKGVDIHTVKGWDYDALVRTYSDVAEKVRVTHTPSLIHVQEVTQPQGHSTSGSHERYKSEERLAFEKDYDCLSRMRDWMIENDYALAEEMDAWEKEDKKQVREWQKQAWKDYQDTIKADVSSLGAVLQKVIDASSNLSEVQKIKTELEKIGEPERKDVYQALRKAQILTASDESLSDALKQWKKEQDAENDDRFHSHLYSETEWSALKVEEVKAVYPEEEEIVDGRKILQSCFDAALGRDPSVIAFGEDVGYLGDVNQAFEGMQEKYGLYRVSDTGIRECTIVGQGIGMAVRGLRPIAEIQYLDYLLYAIQIISDDLCTLRWRTKGGQKAPLIIRTRGHRLEGIWHSGSPMQAILGTMRGMHVLVPRNMTQAAGFYNTMLQSDDPALIIEVLNGYRLKEPMPTNIGEFTVPVGVPEVLHEGSDITLVTYGPNCRLAMEATEILARLNISVELIDVQSLLPFDVHHSIVESLKKTNRVLFLDEDVSGGATAYMMQQVLEVQRGYRYLDSAPATLCAADHRPAYGTDGDYFSKPNVEQILETITNIMNEANPSVYKKIF